MKEDLQHLIHDTTPEPVDDLALLVFLDLELCELHEPAGLVGLMGC